MTDKSQQRERFEAEWDQHNTAIEPHEMIRYGMVKAIAFRYWQAALSQPAVAGAVDEKMEQEMYIAWVISTGGSRDTGEYLWRNNGVSVQAWNHRATIRTASPSQPAAEGNDDLDWPAGVEFTFSDSPGEHDPCFVVMPGGSALSVNHHAKPGVDIARAKFIIAACNAALRATPADDGEMIRFASYAMYPPNTIKTARGKTRILTIEQMLAAFRQQDKQS